MPGDRGAEDLSLGLDQVRLIHRICEDFERAFPDSDRPRIEDFLEKAGGDVRGKLLEELLLLELELRRNYGETPSPSEYRSRFPDEARRVSAAFSLSAESLSPPAGHATDPDATRPYPG